MGRETISRCACKWRIGISIHSLRGEGDKTPFLYHRSYCHFNPLPPWGGRPLSRFWALFAVVYFNPLPPWGGRHPSGKIHKASKSISIHSLRGEGDRVFGWSVTVEYGISIHSLRGEGDRKICCTKMDTHDFNPLPPWGGRRQYC